MNFPFIGRIIQAHLHIVYIYLSWYDIPKPVIRIIISLIEVYWQLWSYWMKFSYSLVLRWLSYLYRNIYFNDDHWYVPFTVIAIPFIPHTWPISGLATREIGHTRATDREGTSGALESTLLLCGSFCSILCSV